MSVSSNIQELDSTMLFNLKKHLLFDDAFNSNSFLLGHEKKFENTAIKIAANDYLLKYFKESQFTLMPLLPHRNYLVACTSSGVYPIYNKKNLTEFIRNCHSECNWKVLEISKKLYEKLLSEINPLKRIIYMDMDADEYEKLEDKSPRLLRDDKIIVMMRKKTS